MEPDLLARAFDLFAQGERASDRSDGGLGHNYEELFKSLPEQTQAEVLRQASERIGPSALVSNHLIVLKELGRNFVDLRYPFSRYDSLNEAQYSQRSANWVSRGSTLEGADFRYYPEELFGLTFALQEIVEACLLDN